jgi:hypothetical protein
MIDFAKMQERTEACRKATKALGDASFAKYGSYSYAAGYLESVLVQAMLNMSKKDREAIIKELTFQAEKMQKEVDTQTV